MEIVKTKFLTGMVRQESHGRCSPKLNIWKQTKYDKLIYLDADTIVLANIDELFDVEELGAVLGGSVYLKYLGIEAGVLVIRPSLDTYHDLINSMEDDDFDVKMSDQSFLNDYFKKTSQITAIPEKFNRLYKKNPNPIGCSIFHFNSNKPWMDPDRIEKHLLELWWSYYETNNN